tara:strand:- start:290 stop:1159 length:870 start_codon:yes stop_codon:yes gene_type:complete
MGYGDELMATGIAKIQKQKFPDRQIVVGNFKKKIITQSIIFLNNPNIIMDPKKIDKNKAVYFVNSHPGNRPHINWGKTVKGKNIWNFNFKPTPGELYFSKNEIVYAKKILKDSKSFWNKNYNYKYKGIIFIETTSLKINDPRMGFKHVNKDWGHQNWLSLVEKLKKNYLIIQPLHKKSNKYNGIFSFDSDFRQACSVMKFCNIYVGPEGGFGHAAAALNKPGVIIFGGWITPQVTGYDFHDNIYIDIEGSPCGVFSHECDHCKKCMSKITVSMIEESIIKNIYKEIVVD